MADRILLLLGSSGGSAPVGTTIAGVGTTSQNQFVIPRYANGASGAAGQILGWGPNSILAGTASTDDISPESTRAVVITAGFAAATTLWQPIVKGLTIIGHSDNNWAIDGNTVNIRPYDYNQNSPDLYAGLKSHGGGGVFKDLTFYGIPGTGCYLTRGGEALEVGPEGRIKVNAEGHSYRRVFRGLWQNATDSYVKDIEVEAFRDYGVRLGTYQGPGSIQFARLHAYGGGMSEADNDLLRAAITNDSDIVPDGYDSPGIWIDGDNCHGVDCYSENVWTGLLIRGSYAKLDGYYSHTCWVCNLLLAGSHAHISGARIDAGNGTTGVNFANQYNSIQDSTVKTTGTSTAFALNNGTAQTINNCTVDSFGNSAGIGISAGATLNNCKIDITMAGGATGIDLYPGGSSAAMSSPLNKIKIGTSGGTSRIGYGNRINIHVDATITTWAILPPGWNPTTPVKTTNDIRIDGIRFYPLTDEY